MRAELDQRLEAFLGEPVDVEELKLVMVRARRRRDDGGRAPGAAATHEPRQRRQRGVLSGKTVACRHQPLPCRGERRVGRVRSNHDVGAGRIALPGQPEMPDEGLPGAQQDGVARLRRINRLLQVSERAPRRTDGQGRRRKRGGTGAVYQGTEDQKRTGDRKGASKLHQMWPPRRFEMGIPPRSQRVTAHAYPQRSGQSEMPEIRKVLELTQPRCPNGQLISL